MRVVSVRRTARGCALTLEDERGLKTRLELDSEVLHGWLRVMQSMVVDPLPDPVNGEGAGGDDARRHEEPDRVDR